MSITSLLPELLLVAWIITLMVRVNHRLAKIERKLGLRVN